MHTAGRRWEKTTTAIPLRLALSSSTNSFKKNWPPNDYYAVYSSLGYTRLMDSRIYAYKHAHGHFLQRQITRSARYMTKYWLRVRNQQSTHFPLPVQTNCSNYAFVRCSVIANWGRQHPRTKLFKKSSTTKHYTCITFYTISYVTAIQPAHYQIMHAPMAKAF